MIRREAPSAKRANGLEVDTFASLHFKSRAGSFAFADKHLSGPLEQRHDESSSIWRRLIWQMPILSHPAATVSAVSCGQLANHVDTRIGIQANHLGGLGGVVSPGGFGANGQAKRLARAIDCRVWPYNWAKVALSLFTWSRFSGRLWQARITTSQQWFAIEGRQQQASTFSKLANVVLSEQRNWFRYVRAKRDRDI